MCLGSVFPLQHFSHAGCRLKSVYIKFEHYGGLSNKNMTNRQKEGVFFTAGIPQDFIFSILSVWDRHISLGVGAWNLRVSILLMVIVSILFFMVKAVCMETEGGGERPENVKLEEDSQCGTNENELLLLCRSFFLFVGIFLQNLCM